MKKVGIIMGAMLLMALLNMGEVSAQAANIVILVSDNEADLTLAEKVAELLNATIVVTSWGVYNEEVTAEIASLGPSLVLIIGGPRAVVSLYEEDLTDLGINVTRIGGEDRVGTCRLVLEMLAKDYPELLKNVGGAIAYGWDIAALMQIKARKGLLPVLVSENETVDEQILQKFKNVTIMETPYSLRVMERVRAHIGEIAKEERLNITAEVAWEAIEIAENRTALAEELLQNVTIPAASKLLETAQKLLTEAKNAYEDGNYEKAYGLAIAAKAHAEAVIRMAGEDAEMSIRKSLSLKLELKVRMIERVALRLQAIGYNVSQELQLLQQAKEALKRGDTSKALKILEEVEQMIREKVRTVPPRHHKMPIRPGRP
ncbi:cell wall-binding repeat-containing protein [Pyrococcus yayanosii]|uniref:Cell wall-binding repeat 2 family protein n=1 Tax=Pyrococcus yayanosii (strain CH1 / JCM 16557) TaxID=529709 RepID=F8AHS8_PYRYC|nr:cell wall-binding repeat-containing protein [Pyrococcus yayanosii]AEH24211.1 hypothetical protein PYCH_05210 [Pyrococcus yayanosii CH1]